MLELRPLSEQDLPRVHAAMLDAFADYPIPMQPALPAFDALLRRRGVVWPLSLGAFEADALLGFTLTARTGALAYDVMTGVRRSAQGRGLVGELFAELWPRLRAEGIERIQLEVIDVNERAVRAYERLGFIRRRKLISWRWDAPIVERASPTDLVIAQAEAEPSALDWPTWASWSQCEPAWPSQRATIERSEPRLVLEASLAGRVCAVAIASGADLLQIMVAPEHRRCGIASALLAGLAARGCAPQRVLNVDASAEPLLAWLASSGARPFITQWEMVAAASRP